MKNKAKRCVPEKKEVDHHLLGDNVAYGGEVSMLIMVVMVIMVMMVMVMVVMMIMVMMAMVITFSLPPLEP